ncbi:MAG: hypothetical protein MZW92_17035 [Comamonadaceae bacterium]|nr:hypothetical protein [Comamonadaceae bacterium]
MALRISRHRRGQAVEGEAARTIAFDRDGERNAEFRSGPSRSPAPARIVVTGPRGRQAVRARRVDLPVRPAGGAGRPRTGKPRSAPGGVAELAPSYPGLPGTNKVWLELSPLEPIRLTRKGERYLIGYPATAARSRPSPGLPPDPPARGGEPVRMGAPGRAHQRPRRRRQALGVPGALGRPGFLPAQRPGGRLGFRARRPLPPGRLAEPGYEGAFRAHRGPLEAPGCLGRGPGFPASKWAKATQAYRLYVLARAGKPNAAAMNRLRDAGSLPTQAV